MKKCTVLMPLRHSGTLYGVGESATFPDEVANALSQRRPPTVRVESETSEPPMVQPSGEQAASGIDVSTATQEQIEAIDGLGTKTAEAIIAAREANGGSLTAAQLMDIPRFRDEWIALFEFKDSDDA